MSDHGSLPAEQVAAAMYQMLLDGRTDEAFALLDATDLPAAQKQQLKERLQPTIEQMAGLREQLAHVTAERHKAEDRVAQIEQDQEAVSQGIAATVQELGGIGESWSWAERLGVKWDVEFHKRHADLALAAAKAIKPNPQEFDGTKRPAAAVAQYRERLSADIAERYQR